MVALHTILQEMREYASKYHVPIIRGEEIELLTQIISQKKPQRILEIGTAIGYSAILMAMASPDAVIITIEKEEERVSLAQQYLDRAGFSDRISIISGDANEVLPFLPGRFDAVFIDAAKGHYLANLEAVLDKLEPGAVIIADNVLFRGWVTQELAAVPRRYRTIVKRLKAYLDFVQNEASFQTTIYTEGDGLAVTYFGGKMDE